MVGRLPLEEDILGSSPSSATKHVLHLLEDIFVFYVIGLERRRQARDDLVEPGLEKNSIEFYRKES